MASAGLGKELECSVCLNLYTDPVTLRCGHNFCRVCIDQFLNTQDGSGVYSCPECRGEFQERPALQKNITLCNVVENFLSTHQDEAVIFCTYCVDSPVPAVKSCLMCEASLCDKHLKVHSKGPEHVLTEPRTSLENRKCPIHKEVLKYYCTEDSTCICVSCYVIGEHNGHELESIDKASEKKKEKYKNVQKKLVTKRKKTEERVQSLEKRRRKTHKKASRETENIAALFIDTRRRLDDLEKRILSEISRQEEKMSLSLSDVIQKLEIKKNELSRKMRDIEELCNMTDPLTVLQDPDTGDLCDPEEEGGDEDTGGHDGGDEDTDDLCDSKEVEEGYEDTDNLGNLEEEDEGDDEDTDNLGNLEEEDEGDDEDTDVSYDPEEEGSDEDTDDSYESIEEGSDEDSDDLSDAEEEGSDEDTLGHGEGDQGLELVSRISHALSDIIKDVIFYVHDPADILLDVKTACNNILIADDLKTATWTQENQNRPDTAERFQYNQMMSSTGFTSGQHYWDVEIGISEDWRVGMCYTSIDRKGRQSYIGDNNKSWGLCGGEWCNNRCSVIHDSKMIKLPHQISSDRFRICLDYEAGQLSFYELCDPIRHLHTFTTTFTEPLHAVLCVILGSIKISGGGAAVRGHHNRGNLPRDWLH
ncbi:E3 ubiquitin/ISG15 ligase TRIM25-like [Hyla sarda]|uniref:E3 ubiquitin/ISG15 ligase TRIM25-like n=1 Tax=Hyla sarda TaxID=327740 RepID=UPI0024C42168|nr:E3 ubiquitin/ISG15 ligase TRIM25-like [Hyla sarda]